MPPTPPEPETETEPEFAEVDPTGRYGRVMPSLTPIRPSFLLPSLASIRLASLFLLRSFDLFGDACGLLQYTEVLGKGAFKTVYPFVPWTSFGL